MAFWNKKKKNDKKSEEKSSQTTKQPTVPFHNQNNQYQHNVIKQQTSRFDVNPEFFDYEKVKLNSFLTDSEEYNRKKAIDDLANGDPNSIKDSKNQIDLKSRFKADESAFDEIYTNLDRNNRYSDFEFNQIKTKSINNVNHLNKDEIRNPVSKRLVNCDFYREVGHNLDQNYEKISNDTKKFLQEMQTKILDLNNLNDPLINKADTDYTRGGWQTTNKYNLDNTIINTYDKLYENSLLNKKPVDESVITRNDFESLKTVQFTKPLESNNNNNNCQQNNYVNNNFNQQVNFNQDLNNLRTMNLNPNQPNPNQFNDYSGISSNRLNTINFDNDIDDEIDNDIVQKQQKEADEAYSEYKRKTKQLLEEAQTIDQIVNREINKEIDLYHKRRQEVGQNITNLLSEENENRKQQQKEIFKMETNGLDFSSLIPVNEIKMNLRIRKGERRNFVFNHNGHF